MEKWNNYNGATIPADRPTHKYVSHPSSSTAILVPLTYAATLHDKGPHHLTIKFGNNTVTSIHAIDMTLKNNSTFPDTMLHYNQMMTDPPPGTMHYIGIDANTTPTPNTNNTGPHVLIRNHSTLSTQRLDLLLATSKTRVPQTYNQENNEIWTRSRNPHLTSQIDYVLIPKRQEKNMAKVIYLHHINLGNLGNPTTT